MEKPRPVSDEQRAGATYWFMLGLYAIWYTDIPEQIAEGLVMTATECFEYAMEVVYPILVRAPPPKMDWAALDE